jgi:membrane-associated protease RseP (regulator of RpoE activity)
MSEPTPTLPIALERDRPQEVWIIQPPRQRLWLHILLLAATFLSTMLVGAHMQSNFASHQPVFSINDDITVFLQSILRDPSRLLSGVPFSLTLMFILLAHEMGHYLYARHYHVYATLPYFIPFPSLIGTLGAFIRIKSPIPSRPVLFDIGVAGPIAGFIPSSAAVLAGLSLSQPLGPSIGPLDNQPGFPLFFHLAARFLHIGSPLASLSLHPIAAAGWIGLFATALNLLPGGQLDGGHIFYSVFPKWHRWVSLLTVAALLLLASGFWVWLIWAGVLWLTSYHPPVPTHPGISPARKWIAASAIVMLILAFNPVPFAHNSGREFWSGIREDLRDEVRHLLHRN